MRIHQPEDFYDASFVSGARQERLYRRPLQEVIRAPIVLPSSHPAAYAEKRNARDSRASVLEHAGFHKPHLREAGREGAADHDTRFGWMASSRAASALISAEGELRVGRVSYDSCSMMWKGSLQ